MSEKLITIYDIAKEANVSPATVSRVLTNSARVSPAKEKIIRELFTKYNFQPNAMAKSLSDTQTRTIGLIVSDIRNPYYAEISVACETAAHREGYRVLLCNALNDAALEDGFLEMLVAKRTDAIIQIGGRVDDLAGDRAYIERINRLPVPFVSTGHLEGADMYTSGIDYEECIALAFEHLLSMGHERIALMGGFPRVRSTYTQWMKYIYLLGVHHIPMRQGYVQEGDYSFDGGVACMKRLLVLEERPTAVIAINDNTASGAIAALRAAGLSVPEDMSIVSHDNTFLAEITSPALTSIDYGYENLGSSLVNTALCLIKKEAVPREALLKPVLAARNSCAPI